MQFIEAVNDSKTYTPFIVGRRADTLRNCKRYILQEDANPDWLRGVLQERESILHEGRRVHEASLTVLPRKCYYSL